MQTPLNNIDWPTRSENRIRLLELLAERPHTRSELQEAIGVTRVTVNRMIEQSEARGWIDDLGRNAEITPCGRLMLDHLRAFREAAATAQKLRDVQQHLPVEAFDFDLRRFGDAEIVYPSQYDLLGPLEGSTDIAVSSEHLRVIGSVPDSIHLRSALERYENGEGPEHVERVFTAGELDSVVANPNTSQWLRIIHEFEHIDCTYFRHEGNLPYGLTIADEMTVLQLFDDQGFVPAIITTDDDFVFAWAESTFERYKREAEPIDPEVLTP